MSGITTPKAPASLCDVLRHRAQEVPGMAFTFLVDGELEEARMTFSELDERARATAVALLSVTRPGERAMLLFPPGLDFIAAFFGCIYAGVVAVPTYPPDPTRLGRTLPRMRAIAADAGATVVLTTKTVLMMAEMLLTDAKDLSTLRWIAVDDVATTDSKSWSEPDLDESSLAFLQYTSGSTGALKGVMVSHGNILHNERFIQRAFGVTDRSCCVGWLPLYHDMGLLGMVLQPLFAGYPVVFMSPVAFLQRPFRWVSAISRYKGTVSAAPNFAYDLCVRKTTPEQRASLDLSSWTRALNGAEPIRPHTLQRFCEAFGPCGFRADAFHPCYGLAEATLTVSGGNKAARPATLWVETAGLESNLVVRAGPGDTAARELVGCGQIEGETVIIVDPATRRVCAPDRVGEIWVASPSVARGYWARTELTEETFHARTADTDEGPFLRTGDLGFLSDGDLYIVGRIKDVIILHGRNCAPHDIEMTVEQCHSALRPGCGAAFTIDGSDEEWLIIVHEVASSADSEQQADIIECICWKVAEEHELPVHAIALLKAGTIPKTSSGKIMRHACRSGFLRDELEVVRAWRQPSRRSPAQPAIAPSGHTESSTPRMPPVPPAERAESASSQPRRADEIAAYLAQWIACHVGVDTASVDRSKPLASFGIDSVLAIELAKELEGLLGAKVDPTVAFDYPSIDALASHLATRRRE
jgi:acyl-CoA synthetase (AMP-forming)/AMP-acid ligase II/acyl carrier protein